MSTALAVLLTIVICILIVGFIVQHFNKYNYPDELDSFSETDDEYEPLPFGVDYDYEEDSDELEREK